jgi:hypothetical protein
VAPARVGALSRLGRAVDKRGDEGRERKGRGAADLPVQVEQSAGDLVLGAPAAVDIVDIHAWRE